MGDLTSANRMVTAGSRLSPEPDGDAHCRPPLAAVILHVERAGGQQVTISNVGGQIAGAADFFQWGLADGNDVDEGSLGGGGYDLQSAGVQSFPSADGTDALMVFPLSTHDRWSNAAVNEYDGRDRYQW
jgi:hypothetical protein